MFVSDFRSGSTLDPVCLGIFSKKLSSHFGKVASILHFYIYFLIAPINVLELSLVDSTWSEMGHIKF